MPTYGLEIEPDFWKVTWQFEGEAFEALRSLADEETFKAQEVIFEEGSDADAMFLVLEGYALAVTTDADSGEQRTVSIIASGQSFGELALLIRQPRRAAVVAGTDVRVLRVSTDALKRLEEQNSRAAAILYRKLAETLSAQLLLRADRSGGSQS